MKKHLATLVLAIIGLIVFVAVLGRAGDVDYTEYCILRMSYEEYDTIKASLTKLYGHEPSERDIANWWAEHNR